MSTWIEPGDLVSSQKGPFRHRGIALPGCMVLHNTPTRGEHVSTLQEFGGSTIRIEKPGVADRERILANASAIVRNPKRFDVFLNNCEHTVTKAIDGTPKSQQLQSWLLGIGIGVGLWFLAARR